MAPLNDILIDVRETGTAIGMSGRTVATGDGDDLVQVFATSTQGTATAVNNSTIDTGAGNDTLDFVGTARGAAYGMAGSTVSAGGGNNAVNVSATSATSLAYGVGNSTILGGNGGDLLTIAAQGSGATRGVSYGTIDLGAGINAVGITAAGGGGANAHGMYQSKLFGGKDTDRFHITATNTGNVNASAIDNTLVELKEGDNTLELNALTQNGVSTGAWYATINGGSTTSMFREETGQWFSRPSVDSVTINSESTGTGRAYGIYGGKIDLMDGTNHVDITAVSAGGSAYGVIHSNVYGGSGEDEVHVVAKAGGNGGAYALYVGDIRVGDGENTVTLLAESVDGEAKGISCGIFTGKDDDYITVTGRTLGTGNALGMTGEIEAGDGNNTIGVFADAVGGNAVALGGGYVLAGSGDDQVTISARSAGGAARGISSATLDVGGGSNTVDIDVTGSGRVNCHGMLYGKLYGGNGTDRVSITAVNTGNYNAAAVDHSQVYMKDGDNILDCIALTQNGTASTVWNGTIVGGEDSDRIAILGEASGTGQVYAMYDSSVDMKGGANAINVTAASAGGSASAVENTTISSGAGNDEFHLTARAGGSGLAKALANGTLSTGAGEDSVELSAVGLSASSKAYAMYGGTIDTGAGSDMIHLHAHGVNAAASYGNSTVQAGAGNDIVRLDHTGGGLVDFAVSGKLTLDGGVNDAVYHAASHGSSRLGDVLALEHDYAKFDVISKLATQVTANNFETLMVDLTDGRADSGYDLDSLLSAVLKLRAGGNSAMTNVMVSGDAGLDSVDAHARLGNAVATDVHVDGFTDTYDHYQVNYDNQVLDLYLKSGIGIV